MSVTATGEKRPHVVIVGGGFGGMNAARALKNAPVQITLIDRNNHHLFQPLLYQVATAGLSPADIATPIRGIFSRQRNVEVMMAEVQGVDTRRQVVLLPDREVPYDYLILATGATDNYFGHDEWAQYAHALKTIPQATAIRREVLMAFEAAEIEADPIKRNALLTFVLIGAGPTGVEMAGAIAEIAHKALAADFRHIDPQSTRILLVEAGPRILSTFPESLSAKAQKELESMRVEVRVNTRVECVDAEGVIASGARIPSKTVIWSAGVQASPAGKWLGAATDRAGRVKVEPNLSAPGLPNVFVIGDTMAREQDGKPLPGVAPVAMQQGAYVAKWIRSHVERTLEPLPFHYVDKGNLATIGRSFAILDIHGFKLSGFLAWVLWLTIHIFYLIGFRNRILVLIQWAWAYLTYQRGTRLIVRADPAEMQARPTEPKTLQEPAPPAPEATEQHTPRNAAKKETHTV